MTHAGNLCYESFVSLLYRLYTQRAAGLLSVVNVHGDAIDNARSIADIISRFAADPSLRHAALAVLYVLGETRAVRFALPTSDVFSTV